MRGCVLAIGIAVLAAACDRPDEGPAAPEPAAPAAVRTPPTVAPDVASRGERHADVGARRLAVVARLADLLDPSDAPLVGSRCVIDGERRPALGCTTWHDVGEWKTGAGGPADPLAIPLPHDGGAPRPRMLEWSLRKPGEIFETPRPATILGASETALRVDPPEVAGKDAPPGTRMKLRARPTLPERIVTSPVDVRAGSSLELALAIDTTMPHDDVEAVVFTLSAETAAGVRPLLESRLTMTDPAAGLWSDHQIALDALVGSPVRFVFTTRLLARDGADPARVAALPLWGAPEILAPSDNPALDVILISFDTLRADHVGAYGSDLPTTPNLDELAAEGVVFDDVFSAYPSTTASHMSILTGLYPVTHGVNFGSQAPRRKVPSLATVLGSGGWRTAAVTEDGLLRADAGFSNGVSFYREIVATEEVGKESRLAASTFDAAIRWITAHADERFFLFLHTYVVHWPYEPPAEFDIFKTWRHDGVETPLADAPRMQQFRHRYAGEARFGDALFGRLRTELARLGLADRTLVVVTSDHGEEFGEHGGWSHAHTLYDEVLHVPLIFWAPDALGAPRRVAGPASLVDLMPTVLDILHVPAPPGLEGQSLLGPAPPNRVIFAENNADGVRRMMARTRDAKWIWNFQDHRLVEAFDLRTDPGERRPIADAAFDARGEPFLADYVGRSRTPDAPPADVPGPQAPMDAETGEKLRGLGYAE